MAQMPRGEPRSVPDPYGELYDEMLRRERQKKQLAEAKFAPWEESPSAVLLTATGSRGRPAAKLIRNPAGLLR